MQRKGALCETHFSPDWLHKHFAKVLQIRPRLLLPAPESAGITSILLTVEKEEEALLIPIEIKKRPAAYIHTPHNKKNKTVKTHNIKIYY